MDRTGQVNNFGGGIIHVKGSCRSIEIDGFHCKLLWWKGHNNVESKDDVIMAIKWWIQVI